MTMDSDDNRKVDKAIRGTVHAGRTRRCAAAGMPMTLIRRPGSRSGSDLSAGGGFARHPGVMTDRGMRDRRLSPTTLRQAPRCTPGRIDPAATREQADRIRIDEGAS